MPLRISRPHLPQFKRPALPARSDLVLYGGGACLIAACLFVFAGPGLDEVRRANREQTVRNNAATLQLAAETWAAMHQGRYPADPLDLVPLLPGNRAPQNPYTGETVRFTDEPGGLTYRTLGDGRDYVIEAWGDAAAATPLVRFAGRSAGGRPRLAGRATVRAR